MDYEGMISALECIQDHLIDTLEYMPDWECLDEARTETRMAIVEVGATRMHVKELHEAGLLCEDTGE